MDSNINKIWTNFFSYIKNNNICCSLKNLNSSTKDKEIYVMKLCDSNIINDFVKQYSNNDNKTDLLYINPLHTLFIALIPHTSKTLISLFCCKITMENIYSKLSNYGLAIEGCFNIEPISIIPSFFQGHEFNTNNFVTKGTNISSNKAFLIIDNHNIIKIINGIELESFKPYGTNVQYIEGKRLYENGKPYIDFSTIKKVTVRENDGSLTNIDGSNVIIDYAELKIKINGIDFNFSEIGTKINFVYNSLFEMNHGLLVLMMDAHNNICLFNHENIDIFNMLLLLKIFDCKDAIVLCDSTKINIIWKENGYNTYNKTDFIGNPQLIVSNVIVFSG